MFLYGGGQFYTRSIDGPCVPRPPDMLQSIAPQTPVAVKIVSIFQMIDRCHENGAVDPGFIKPRTLVDERVSVMAVNVHDHIDSHPKNSAPSKFNPLRLGGPIICQPEI